MSTNAFSLDDIRSAVEAKYGATEITLSDGSTVKLVNVIRLPKAKRETIKALQSKLNADDADQEALLAEALVTVASSPARGQALVDDIAGDLAVLAMLFEKYTGETQAGEASASPS